MLFKAIIDIFRDTGLLYKSFGRGFISTENYQEGCELDLGNLDSGRIWRKLIIEPDKENLRTLVLTDWSLCLIADATTARIHNVIRTRLPTFSPYKLYVPGPLGFREITEIRDFSLAPIADSASQIKKKLAEEENIPVDQSVVLDYFKTREILAQLDGKPLKFPELVFSDILQVPEEQLDIVLESFASYPRILINLRDAKLSHPKYEEYLSSLLTKIGHNIIGIVATNLDERIQQSLSPYFNQFIYVKLDFITEETTTLFLHQLSNLTELHILNSFLEDWSFLQTIAIHRKLITLNLSNTNITLTNLGELSQQYPSLTVLDLSQCKKLNEGFKKQSLNINPLKLASLSVNDSTIDPNVLKDWISRSAKELKELNTKGVESSEIVEEGLSFSLQTLKMDSINIYSFLIPRGITLKTFEILQLLGNPPQQAMAMNGGGNFSSLEFFKSVLTFPYSESTVLNGVSVLEQCDRSLKSLDLDFLGAVISLEIALHNGAVFSTLTSLSLKQADLDKIKEVFLHCGNQLTSLKLVNCNNINQALAYAFSNNIRFNHLRHLEITEGDDSINETLLNQIMDQASDSLEEFSFCLASEENAHTSRRKVALKIDKPLPFLRKISLGSSKNDISFDSSTVFQLLQKLCDSLEELYLDGDSIQGFIEAIKSGMIFSALRELILERTSEIFTHLDSLLTSCLHITYLHLHRKDDSLEEGLSGSSFQRTLENGKKWQKLTTLYIDEGIDNEECVKNLLALCPSLQILVSGTNNPLDKSEIPALFPDLKIYFDEEYDFYNNDIKLHPETLWNNSHNNKCGDKNLSIDANTDPSHNNILNITEYFLPKENGTPSPGDYRLNPYELNARVGGCTIRSPTQLQTVNVNPFTRTENVSLKTIYLNEYTQNDNIFYAEKTTDFQENAWNRLPSLSPDEEILTVEIIPNANFRIAKDEATGFHFISFEKCWKGTLSYLIKTKSITNWKSPFREESTQETIEFLKSLISNFRFTEEGKLKADDNLKRFCSFDRDIQFVALVQYCQAFEQKALPLPLPTEQHEILNLLLQYGRGACRHRSHLFLEVAQALGFKNLQRVNNDCHSFVEYKEKEKWTLLPLNSDLSNLRDIQVTLNNSHLFFSRREKEKWIRLDFGGYRPKLKYSKKISTKTTKELSNELLSKKEISTPSFFSLFNKEIPAPEVTYWSDYISWVIHQKAPIAIQFHDKKHINDFHRALLYANISMHFIGDLDKVFAKTIWIRENRQKKQTESETAQFLRSAKPGSILFIDMSEAKSYHTDLINMAIDETRKIAAEKIPPFVPLFFLVTGEIGADFQSRMRAITHCPCDLLLTQPFRDPLESFANDYIINLYNDDNWQKRVIGVPTINGEQMHFLAGDIFQAIRENKNLFFQNPPQNSRSFDIFFNTLFITRKFYVNDSWHDLPENMSVRLGETTYDANQWRNITQPTYFDGNFDIDYALNSGSFSYFFTHHVPSEKGILEHKGLLESFADEMISVLITESLPEHMMAQLLTEAQKNNCILNIKILPNVQFPFPVLTNEITREISPLTSFSSTTLRNHITAIFQSADCDVTVKKIFDTYPDEDKPLVICIHEKTSYEDITQYLTQTSTRGNFRFSFSIQEGSILNALKNNHDVILKGILSESLAQRLSTLFFNSPYLWVNGTRQECTGKLLIVTPKIPDTLRWTEQCVTDEIEDNDNTLPMDLSTTKPVVSNEMSIACSSTYTQQKIDPIQQRFDQIQNIFAHSPWVFIDGKTGVGITSFFLKELPALLTSEQGKVYVGFDQLVEWATAESGILFFDEDPLEKESDYDLFEGLNQISCGVLYKSIFYPLSKNHKVIFVKKNNLFDNLEHPLPEKYPNATVIFEPYPDWYLKEKFIFPFLKKDEKLNESDKEEIADKFLTIYNIVNTQDGEYLLTPRNLQMMGLRFLTLCAFAKGNLSNLSYEQATLLSAFEEIEDRLNEETKKELFQESINEEVFQNYLDSSQQTCHLSEFVLTRQHKTGLQKLQFWFEMKNVATEIKLPFAIPGIVFQGDPGIGKTTMVSKFLESSNFVEGKLEDPYEDNTLQRYYIITSADLSNIKKILARALAEKALIVRDEYNTLSLEGDVSKFLDAGGSLIGTQNSVAIKNREKLSPAARNRVVLIHLNYTPEEAIKILSSRYSEREKTQIENLVKRYFMEREESEKPSSRIIKPTFRDLLFYCEDHAGEVWIIPGEEESVTLTTTTTITVTPITSGPKPMLIRPPVPGSSSDYEREQLRNYTLFPLNKCSSGKRNNMDDMFSGWDRIDESGNTASSKKRLLNSG